MTPEESDPNPLEDIAKELDKVRMKMLYVFMHRAMPTFGLKFTPQLRDLLSRPNADEHASNMLARAWTLVAKAEGQEPQPIGGLKHEIRPILDVPGKMILVWPPESPKVMPMGHLSAIVVPDNSTPRYFVLEYSEDIYDKSAQHFVLCEWVFEEGNPNPCHKNYSVFTVKEKIDVDAFANRVSMMVAHPGAKLDESILQTSTSADGTMNVLGGKALKGVDIKVDVPADPSKRKEVLGKLLKDIKAATQKKPEDSDES